MRRGRRIRLVRSWIRTRVLGVSTHRAIRVPAAGHSETGLFRYPMDQGKDRVDDDRPFRPRTDLGVAGAAPAGWRSGSPRKRRPLGAHARASPAHRRSRPRRPLHLPLLRGRLRPARLRAGGARQPDRGRSRQPHLARAAVPQGRCQPGLRDEPVARVPGQVSPAARHGVGGAPARPRDEHDRRPDDRRPARDAGRTPTSRTAPCAARSASRTWAARPWTTRRTTRSRSS